MRLIPAASDGTGSDEGRRPEWTWTVGLVVESAELLAEIEAALLEVGAKKAFELQPSIPSFEVANAVDREHPEVLFVELARASKAAADWLLDVRRGDDMPLVVAVHPSLDPAEMISALRAGASEFLSLPVRPTIYEAMERLGVLLESRRNATVESGKIVGVLSAKGGCGATSLACYLSAALQTLEPRSRILVADLDYQSPGVPQVFRRAPQSHAGEAFDGVRRISSSTWREFVISVRPGLDVLASPAFNDSGEIPDLPEPWRMESLFRFILHHYNWILVDLGRHLNPYNWSLLQHIEELLIVTAPDVLALYQTRSVLQTLTGRGFDKSRVKLVLNRNQTSPADFWVESIQQMFEMSVFGVIPNDEATFEKLARDRFDLPEDTPFGRQIAKIAARLAKGNGSASTRRAA
jgi:pilus assembly protein CpaE